MHQRELISGAMPLTMQIMLVRNAYIGINFSLVLSQALVIHRFHARPQTVERIMKVYIGMKCALGLTGTL